MVPLFVPVPSLFITAMKKLILCRTYHINGTNGLLYSPAGELLCYTIELPWRNNRVRESCIPEGTYRLTKRYSQKFKHHIHLENVTDRSLILIHPANNAATELLGCIAPVTKLTGPGTGNSSRVQFEKIKEMVYKWIDQGEEVTLDIKENT